MDESERLVALAAMSPPEEAVAAWRLWRATTEIAAASGLLVWAGGYIHRNLLAAGLDDPYLGGIYRYNLIANNRKVSAVLPVIRELTGRWIVTPLKSFGMSSANYSRGLRPLADFDFYVAPDDIVAVRSFLKEQGFPPNLGVSDREFSLRITPQRGSWNFVAPGRGDLDLHWRVFDHLDLDENESIVARHSAIVDSEFGPIRRLSDEVMLVLLAVHAVVESQNTVRGWFDIYQLLRTADVETVAALAAEIGIERDLLGVCDDIEAIVGDVAIPQLAQLQDSIRPGALAQSPPDHVTVAPEHGEALPERFMEAVYLRDPDQYRQWYASGQSPELEQRLRRRGTLSRPFPGDARSTDPSVRFPARDGTPTIGWHYLYPGQDFRWANVPDARIVFDRRWRMATAVSIDLEPDLWQLSPVDAVDVFCNGHWVGQCDKSSSSFEFLIRARWRRVELSMRIHGRDRHESGGMHLNWHRMLAPVRRVELL